MINKIFKRLYSTPKSAATILMMLMIFFAFPYIANAEDSGIPSGYKPPNYGDNKPYLMRNLFTEELVRVGRIQLSPDQLSSWNDKITIRLFNSTTQKTEQIIEAEFDWDAYCFCTPELELKKDHNYIIFIEDTKYQLGSKKYVQVLGADNPNANKGAGLYDFKSDYNNGYVYKLLGPINVFKRSEPIDNPFDDNRSKMREATEQGDKDGIPVKYNGSTLSGIKFRLVSDEETIETSSDASGRLHANLIEDIQYMVYVDDDEYWIDPFPLSVKDKSEYKSGRYCYDHSTCHRVDQFTLVKKTDKPSMTDNNHTRKSINGNATVKGLLFNDSILLERKIDLAKLNIDTSLPEETDKLFAFGMYAVNPHRWEISKIVDCEGMQATEKLPHYGTANHVYELKNDQLYPIEFTQEDKYTVTFGIDSLGINPIVVDYTEEAEPIPAIQDGQSLSSGGNEYKVISAKAGTIAFNKSANKKTVTVPATVKAKGKTLKVVQVNAGAFKGKKIRTVIIGQNIRKISGNAFKGSKATKMIVKTKLLKKTSVKGSLKGSKIKRIQIKIGNKKTNKKFAKKYKKYFTKKNAGKKATVK